MKKLAPIILAAICAVSVPVMAQPVANSNTAQVELKAMSIKKKEKSVEFASFEANGVTYIQMRELAEFLGNAVRYDSATNSIYLYKSRNLYEQNENMKTGVQTAYIKDDIEVLYEEYEGTGENIYSGVVFNIDGYTYCPIDVVLKAFGYTINSDANMNYELTMQAIDEK